MLKALSNNLRSKTKCLSPHTWDERQASAIPPKLTPFPKPSLDTLTQCITCGSTDVKRFPPPIPKCFSHKPCYRSLTCNGSLWAVFYDTLFITTIFTDYIVAQFHLPVNSLCKFFRFISILEISSYLKYSGLCLYIATPWQALQSASYVSHISILPALIMIWNIRIFHGKATPRDNACAIPRKG